jgi:hypothetical protein
MSLNQTSVTDLAFLQWSIRKYYFVEYDALYYGELP